jgi:hypothetical protein
MFYLNQVIHFILKPILDKSKINDLDLVNPIKFIHQFIQILLIQQLQPLLHIHDNCNLSFPN